MRDYGLGVQVEGSWANQGFRLRDHGSGFRFCRVTWTEDCADRRCFPARAVARTPEAGVQVLEFSACTVVKSKFTDRKI